ncbi:Ig-like domain-containing protein [Nonomuraea africana]|uniref:Lipoprotein-anchoring transpeptidase ErfK/SrfK n=1 Tax=Nonomuraea africana TaxID=46171 RepID=A0ABR9KPP1_9ACTN|nr:L,D-transpeptidase [Nonomuraea africana]MBE1563726.1 lipoprotein-anchoring transpeptidase ErfK/SrfK [Nonomuraea africana]
MRRALLLLSGLLLAGGCSLVRAEGPAAPAPPVIAVSPAFDTDQARPDRGLVVKATGGRLSKVDVYAGGVAVPGRLDPTGTLWRSTWTLPPGVEHTVTVTATATGPEGPATLAMGRFRTRAAARAFKVASVSPQPGEAVGVGAPIIVTFDSPIRDKAAVERAMEVHSTKPVEGAWRWTSDTEAVYRTRHYWPARQQVALTAHLAGVRSAPGVYGTADHELAFTIGRRQTSAVNTLTHQMVVRRDGRIVQSMAISAGMGTTREYTTTSGIHLTMEKGNPVRMISPGRSKGEPGFYDLMIDHAVRISNSGEYVHAKNNIWAQGRVNVSHGCVNARPDQAAWFYDNSLRGDPVTVIGTDRELEWNNGWGYWQLPWEKWIQGSALYDPRPSSGWIATAPPPNTLP